MSSAYPVTAILDAVQQTQQVLSIVFQSRARQGAIETQKFWQSYNNATIIPYSNVGKVKPSWPHLSATQSRRQGLQGASNLVFNGQSFHWGGWPVPSLAASPSTELKNLVYSFRAESTRWPSIWRSTGFEPQTSGIAVQRANHQTTRPIQATMFYYKIIQYFSLLFKRTF